MSTLLLLHPTMASEPALVEESKRALKQKFSDSYLDQYMIGLIASGKQELPLNTYKLIHYLAPAGAAKNKFNAPLMAALYGSLQPGGSFEGVIPDDSDLLAIKTGFLVNSDESRWTKPNNTNVVSLKRRVRSVNTSTLPTFSRVSTSPTSSTGTPGLTDSSSEENDDFDVEMDSKIRQNKLNFFEDEEDEEDLFNEDELLQHTEIADPTIAPLECSRTGKRRRRACKNCTCGLKEKEEREEAQQRSLQDTMLGRMAMSATEEAIAIENRINNRKQKVKASKQGSEVKFTEEEMTEIDFTVEGKTGGCGSCALGDAFRCSTCPYLGLPAFKPGQPISLDAFGEDI